MANKPRPPILGANEGDEGDEDGEPVYRTITPIRDVPDEQVFRFEIGPAILRQLLEKLDKIPRSPIQEALGAKYPGFYQLFLNGEAKYIGKTSRPVGARLREHVRKLRGRVGISLENVQCRYAFVEDPSLVDVAEGALIDFFYLRGLAEWNLSGFGSKVTGYGRGRTAASEWSLQFPPDPALLLEAGADEKLTLIGLIATIGSGSSITFSVPREYKVDFKAAHPELLDVPRATRSLGEWASIVEGFLKPGWRIDRQSMSWYVVAV
ncbi:hypothetical protein [Cystobacter fuscus]|uniref:hypothetical protein n=1 Tax=Cystobacter fuscus TaxID=43 RepID=UPI002B2EB0C9|nr:GIY-YIG nuclease family protein [Cystobacter fuscus]